MERNMNGSSKYSGSCIGSFFAIALLPTLFILFLGINFFGLVGFVSINAYTFYIIIAIYLIFLFFIAHNAFISVCKIKNQFDITRNELEINLEKTALSIDGKTKSVLNVRDFLQDYFKNIRNDNFAKIASSTFPMLGILGTFIAIAVSMPDFTVHNSKELDSEISKLLSGVGTAFYASIFGIFLSLLWTFFERLGLSRIEQLTLSLEDIYSKYIWSQKELLAFKYNQKALMESEFVNVLKDTFNLNFIKSINQEHLESYQKIIANTKDAFAGLESSLQRNAKQIEQTVSKIGGADEALQAQLALKENLVAFNHTAKDLQKLLESFDSGLDKALYRVDGELASAVRHIEKMVAVVKEN